MKNNSVVTNIQQDFTDEEKAQGRRNIDAGGYSKYIVDCDVTASGDLEIHNTSGDLAIQIGDQTIGGLIPEPIANTHLVADSAGKVMWTEDEGTDYSAGQYISIQNDVISATGLQPAGNYLTSADVSGLHNYVEGAYIYITDNNVINVTGLQPAGDYAYASALSAYAYSSAVSGKLDASAYVAPVQSDWNQNDIDALDYIKNKPEIPDLSGYATEEYVNINILSATSGKLDTSAYVPPIEYSAGPNISIEDNVISVTGISPGGEYSAGQYISIQDHVIGVSGTKEVVGRNGISIIDNGIEIEVSYSGGGGGGAQVQSDWTENNIASASYIKNKPTEIGLLAGNGIWLENLSSAVKINCSARSDILVYNFSVQSPSIAVIPQAAGYTEMHITTPYTYDGYEKYSATIDSELWQFSSGTWNRLIYQWNDSNPSVQKWWLAESGYYQRPLFS